MRNVIAGGRGGRLDSPGVIFMRPVISAALAAVLIGCLASAADAKTLVYCSDAAPEGFDPALYVTDATFDASSQALYNRLLEFEPGTTRLRPALAESFDVSDDGLTYTFHIRKGVAFHETPYFTPTRDLNADDVVFSLNRQRDKKNPYYAYTGGVWPYYASMGLDTLIKSIAKVDALTVRIVLTRPDTGFPADLAMDFASILSKEYADSLIKPDKRALLDQKPIGTGPYVFFAAPDGRVTYKANVSYWRGAQKIDYLTFVVMPSAAERYAGLKSGACQVIAAANDETVRAAKGDPKLAVAEVERLDTAYLAFNTTQPPFSDVRVRKALGMAIDRKAIVDAVYGTGAAVARGVLPSSMWSYDASLADPAVDVEGAKALLSEAGVSGLKMKLLATRSPRLYDPDPAKTADMIAKDLAKVGVEATVVTPATLGEYFRQSTAKDRDGAVVIGWTSDNGDPGDYLSLLLGCDAVGSSNRAQWCNASFDDLLKQARATPDSAERLRLYMQAQQIADDQAPLAVIAHTLVQVPMAKAVTGYHADPLGRHNFEGVDLLE
jgi:dipeptide transport system substrate-binding protein